ELGGERNGARAVVDDGAFELADLAAIEARRLAAGERRGGLRGRGEWRECAGGGGRAGGGNDAATGQFGHGVLRQAAPRARAHGGGGRAPIVARQGGKKKGGPRRGVPKPAMDAARMAVQRQALRCLLALHRVRLDQQAVPLPDESSGLRLGARAVRDRYHQLLAG